MDFTSFYKTQPLLKIQLFTKVPGTFCRFTTMPLLCTKHPGENPDLAMWPLGVVAGAAGAIPASSGGGVGRGACEEGLGFARDLFGP
jgi:hypothetical protein